MAINKNHLFDDLDGVKCAIVETEVPEVRVKFLKTLLELNGYSVVTVPSPPPKGAAAAKPAETEEGQVEVAAPAQPEKFTVGVTDVTFNTTNAIFGRLLKTKTGNVVTMAYWQQKEEISQDDIPYFEKEY